MGPLTQEDPIGIAGGLNLYGYANGDPINFSDPFGLCPPEDDNEEDCEDEGGDQVPQGDTEALTPDYCEEYGSASVVKGICRRVFGPGGPESNECVAGCLIDPWESMMARTNGNPTFWGDMIFGYLIGDHPPCYTDCGYTKRNFVRDFLLGSGSHQRFLNANNGCSRAERQWGICSTPRGR